MMITISQASMMKVTSSAQPLFRWARVNGRSRSNSPTLISMPTSGGRSRTFGLASRSVICNSRIGWLYGSRSGNYGENSLDTIGTVAPDFFEAAVNTHARIGHRVLDRDVASPPGNSPVSQLLTPAPNERRVFNPDRKTHGDPQRMRLETRIRNIESFSVPRWHQTLLLIG